MLMDLQNLLIKILEKFTLHTIKQLLQPEDFLQQIQTCKTSQFELESDEK
jgi:hypothetical protein